MDCGKAPLLTKALCAGCAIMHRLASREHRARSVAAGKCNACHKTNAREGRRTCAPCAAKADERNRLNREQLRSEMLTAYGNMCQCCGENKREFLALDHIYGGGNRERRGLGMGMGRAYLTRLKKLGWPKDKYRLLCHNCNASLAYYRYCPHGKEGQWVRGPNYRTQGLPWLLRGA